ncbi:MAG: hypothetical protein N3I86_15120, partial [Verrucomicrobiae bacterium]|nr:hypothetical protein [Verrucomicrobiae bacterium]
MRIYAVNGWLTAFAGHGQQTFELMPVHPRSVAQEARLARRPGHRASVLECGDLSPLWIRQLEIGDRLARSCSLGPAGLAVAALRRSTRRSMFDVQCSVFDVARARCPRSLSQRERAGVRENA